MTGLSSHYSGDGFSGMRFKVHAVPPQQFAAWAQGARGTVPRWMGALMPNCPSPAAM